MTTRKQLLDAAVSTGRLEIVHVTRKLTERRKADRETMVVDVANAALRVPGVKVALNRDMGTREVWTHIKGARGLSLTVVFDGDSSQPDVHVLSWHGVEAPHKLSPSFAPSVNNFHWHKATDIHEGFDGLCDLIVRRLRSAADGTAFQPQEGPADDPAAPQVA